MNWREWKRKNGLQDVTRRNPCPVCGKPDWCLVSADGSFTVCPRTESSRRLGEMGYIHGKMMRPITCPSTSASQKKEASFPVDEVQADLWRQASPDWVADRAGELGVEPDALFMLEVGRTRDGLTTFPMFDHDRRLIGIRIRDPQSGKKWAWPGSCNGLFIPSFKLFDDDITLVVEGPTDASAGMSLGFHTVGRASALSNFDMLRQHFRDKDTEVVIVGELDGGVGIESATKLSAYLAPVASTRMILPKQGKDLRSWLGAGATKNDVLMQIRQASRTVA